MSSSFFKKYYLGIGDEYLRLLNCFRVQSIMIVNSGLLFRTLIFCLLKQASILQQNALKKCKKMLARTNTGMIYCNVINACHQSLGEAAKTSHWLPKLLDLCSFSSWFALHLYTV